MTKKLVRRKLTTGPRNAEEAAIFAAERFRVTLQHSVNTLMLGQGISRQELAARMGVTPARVSQFFSDDCNVTIRTLASILHALGSDYSFAASDSHLVLRAEASTPHATAAEPSRRESQERITPLSSAYVSTQIQTSFAEIVWGDGRDSSRGSHNRGRQGSQQHSVHCEDILPFAKAA